MKTLTITFHHSANYGATLQTYALHQVIKRMGHENVVFEYVSKPVSQKMVFSPKVFLRNVYMKIVSILRKRENKRLQESFIHFHNHHIAKTRPYNDMDDLRNDVPDVDVLITGSDQVWNIKGTQSFVPARFLDFGNKNLLRFSYAASLEKLDYTDEQKSYVKERLKDFKGISLRETSARDYIHSFTGYDCVQVLDPVLLLSVAKWNELAVEPRIKEPYILCYQVLSHPLMQKTVDYLKKKTGYKVVSVTPGIIRWINSDYTLYDVSPEEFLGLYKNAKMVVTTSFHGTAFAILYNKPFVVLAKDGSVNRIRDLLKLFDLKDQLLLNMEAISVPDIDYMKVNATLVKERERSLSFLRKMLNE